MQILPSLVKSFILEEMHLSISSSEGKEVFPMFRGAAEFPLPPPMRQVNVRFPRLEDLCVYAYSQLKRLLIRSL